MTSHYYPLYCESAISRYPCIGKISTKEENPVDFIYQFVKDVKRHLIDNHDTLSTALYISGAPTKFPKYGDFANTFTVSTYGFDISISSRHANDAVLNLNISHKRAYNIENVDRIEFEFHEAVYPIRVSLYEVYNPGHIIKIWAQDSQNDDQWFLLWEGSPQIVPSTSRLFSPPLRSCNFKTKMLRLEFKHSVLYYTKLDAVMLIGTSELILPRNSEESLTNLLKKFNCTYSHNEDVQNLTADYENAHLDIEHFQKNFLEHCIICRSDIEKSFYKNNFGYKKAPVFFWKVIPDYVQDILSIIQRYSHRFLLKNYCYYMKRMDEYKELSRCSLSALPDEIILKILKNLDLATLCRMNQINRRFYNLTLDPRLYTRLNMRNICCPTHLTHLRLRKCECVDDKILFKISEICKDLKELDLTKCKKIEKEGFSYLKNLENLEYLKLGRTEIRSQSICKILQKNKWLRELDLHYTFLCSGVNLLDDSVATELRNSCQNLEIINLYGAGCTTTQGINALSNCKYLRKLYIHIGGQVVDDSLSRLLSCCQLLEELYLDCFVLTDRNLKLLTECKNLKHLQLYYVNFVTPDNFSVILEQCPKLQHFYLVGSNISPQLTDKWKKSHPHVLHTGSRLCF